MNRRRILAVAAAGAAGLVLALGVGVVLTAPDTALPWSVFGAAGGSSSSPSYDLGPTAGQSGPIGESWSPHYRLGAGFWYGAGAAPPACIDRLGDTSCDDPVNDPDDDGCTAAQEAALGSAFDGSAAGWYDVYDVPVPAKPDTGPGSGANGKRDRVVDIRDVLAVLLYAFTEPTGVCGDNPNVNGVDYDCVKGVDLDGDSTDDAGTSHNIPEGQKYDRSPGLGPDPVTGIDPAGPPDEVIDIRDVLATLAQAFVVDCSGVP